MSRPKIEISCSECQKKFEKDRREFDRQKRKGAQNFFCCYGCSASFGNRIHPQKGNILNFKGKTKKKEKDEFSPFRYYLRKARQRDKEYDLTLEFIMELWNNQKGKCALTNITLILRNDEKIKPNTASLDRIDSSIGYVKGNVQFVAYSINLAKVDFDNQEFIDFLHEVVLTIERRD